MTAVTYLDDDVLTAREAHLLRAAPRICHGPACGARIPEGRWGYCSERCRATAHRLALAGETWEPAPAWREAVRRAVTTEKPPAGAGRSTRAKQRRAKKAMTT